MPKRWVWPSLLVLCVAGGVDFSRAHESDTPHQLVLTRVAVEGDSLRVALWVERPTPIVLEEFRRAFAPDRQNATAQDERFRRQQWSELASSVFVHVQGRPVELDLHPLSLVNNGRGDERRFVYAVGASLALDELEAGDRLEVELHNQALLDQEHVFLSAYAEADDPWRVGENSLHDLLGRGHRVRRDWATGTTWTHDPQARQWRVVFERSR